MFSHIPTALATAILQQQFDQQRAVYMAEQERRHGGDAIDVESRVIPEAPQLPPPEEKK